MHLARLASLRNQLSKSLSVVCDAATSFQREISPSAVRVVPCRCDRRGFRATGPSLNLSDTRLLAASKAEALGWILPGTAAPRTQGGAKGKAPAVDPVQVLKSLHRSSLPLCHVGAPPPAPLSNKPGNRGFCEVPRGFAMAKISPGNIGV